jgi:hypothetical protein
VTTSAILFVSALVVIVVGCAVLICAFHIPGPDVITGAKPTGPAGMAADTARTALPWLDDPKSGGARIAALDPQAAHRDYEASVHAGLTEGLDDWDLRNQLHLPAQRKEQS